MKRITKTNPQAMAAVATRLEFAGSSLLGTACDGDTWLTPRWILDGLGTFDLDPCACDAVPHWAAPRSFQKHDDGLSQPWSGRVFMNPPYSNTVPWLQKHREHGNGISLVPASVESQVWRSDVWKFAHAVLMLNGRTRFANPDGSTTTGRPSRSVALIAWSLEDAAILERTGFAGVFIRKWSLV